MKEQFTRTSSYILYMLNLPFQDLFTVGKFVNAYLDDEGHKPHYQDCLYIRCKITVNDRFKEFSERLQRYHDYVTSYDLPDGEIMFVFKVPANYVPDLHAFKEGKYSQINKRYITSNFKPDDPRYEVCNRRERLRKRLEKELDVELDAEAELDDIPNPQEEIFRYEQKEVHAEEN